jgi:hypothetical protein
VEDRVCFTWRKKLKNGTEPFALDQTNKRRRHKPWLADARSNKSARRRNGMTSQTSPPVPGTLNVTINDRDTQTRQPLSDIGK